MSMPRSGLLQSVDWPALRTAGVTLDVLRLDLYRAPDSTASGNKYFKLKYNLGYARANGYRSVLSFGGIWSNHLHALALEAAAHGLRSIGIVRSDEPQPSTPTLEEAKAAGMIICPVSRDEYRRRHDTDYLQQLARRFDQAYVIPEGGSNLLGAQGCRDIVSLPEFARAACDVLVLPVGSGGTLAGLLAALPASVAVRGYSVVRDPGIELRIAQLLGQMRVVPVSSWQLRDACSAGSYGKFNRELAQFIVEFSAATGVPLEPTYSGKLFYELCRDISAGCFAPGTRLLALHTGGMQGFRGHEARLLELVA